MAPKLTPWKSVASTEVITEDNGDILMPLKRVRDQYATKADELKEKAFGDNRELILLASENYTRMADCVQRIIGVMSLNDFVDGTAPVDQSETILSDSPDGDAAVV